jgi:predicted transcriptional regulator
MVAQEMMDRGVAVRQVARQLGVTEGALRYRLQRPAAAADGRRERTTALEGWDDRVTAVLERFGDARVSPESETRCETRQVYDVLGREYGFAGSHQAVRRYLRRRSGRRPCRRCGGWNCHPACRRSMTGSTTPSGSRASASRATG